MTFNANPNAVLPMDVSIVIVSWNTRDCLDQTLRSLYKQTQGIRFEVFVVDNGSTDGSVELVRDNYPLVQLWLPGENIGFARGSNLAIRESCGRYVLLLNPDTIILDQAIDRTVDFMDQNPKVGISTCRILNEDRTDQNCYGLSFPNAWGLVTGGTPWREVFSFLSGRPSLPSDQVAVLDRPVAWVMGSYMMVRREVIDQVGLMDEKLFMYGEEIDWCYRAAQHGWERCFTACGQIVHLGGRATSQIDLDRTTRWLMQSYDHFFRKHHGSIYASWCFVVGFMASVCKVEIYRVLAMVGRSKIARYQHKLLSMKARISWYQHHWWLLWGRQAEGTSLYSSQRSVENS